MRIYIPSRGRYTATHTVLRWLTPKLRQRTVYCVRSDELAQYFTALRGNGVKIMDCGLPHNLSEKRDIIARYAAYRGEDKFLMTDDDVALFIRACPTAVNLRHPHPHEVERLFAEMEKHLDAYAMVGVSAREGNNQIGVGPLPLAKECTRAMRLYAFRTADYLSIDANRLPEMQDFDTTLQLLRSGRKNVVYYYWAQGQRDTNAPGGCSIYRTVESHDEVCRQLQELHPEFVRLRSKRSKSGQRGFGARTKVVVSWKKAYESSRLSLQQTETSSHKILRRVCMG